MESSSGRALDALIAAEVRDWLLALRQTLAPISVAGYVRGLKVSRWRSWRDAASCAPARRMA